MRQAHAGSTTGPLTSAPFKHLASAMAYDCIKSATDPDIARATVYLRCVGAQTALLNSKAPQRYADDNAVTASILEIYAAYALRQSSPQSTSQYYAMLNDARRRLTAIAAGGSQAEIRRRTVAARSCLIERDAECLKWWARYQ